jgi:exopolyphosphatase/guanosine-5'-triphosphate,3'-diphosphate pyrophosphatase
MSASARDEVLALMRELETQPGHVAHVTDLALQLFDSLAPLHGLGEAERFLLEAAGYLHDIGHQYDYLGLGHHKQSARIIREHPWRNLSPPQVSVIALLACYHRKSMPDLKHERFAALPDSDRKIVQKLAAVLRLADSLDRSHEGGVSRVSAELLPNQIVFELQTTGPVWREVMTAHAKGDLAQAVFQRDLVFKVGGEVIKPERPR